MRVAFGAALACLVVASFVDADETENPAKARAALAKGRYEAIVQAAVNELEAPPPRTDDDRWLARILNEDVMERLARWSKRIMDAEAEASPNDRAAAAQAHLDRMKAQEGGEILKRWLKDVKQPTNKATLTDPLFAEFRTTARFFRLEAESLLERARRP